MKYIVYALIDPRNGNPFYVGKSCSGLKQAKRHTQPNESRRNKAKHDFIQAMLAEGFKPQVQVVEQCRNKKHLEMRERVVIATYRAQYQLLNCQSNPSHLRS